MKVTVDKEKLPDPDKLNVLAQFLEKLASRSSDALALIKKVSWEGTEHFDKLMPERILMSASLLLEDSTQVNIEKIKQNLGKKN